MSTKYSFVLIKPGRETYYSIGHWFTAEDARNAGNEMAGELPDSRIVVIENRTDEITNKEQTEIVQ